MRDSVSVSLVSRVDLPTDGKPAFDDDECELQKLNDNDINDFDSILISRAQQRKKERNGNRG